MYKQIAQYYDLLHHELKQDISFVSRLSEEVGGPVLELGCGTGRMMVPLLRTGQEVTGVDASAEMLAVARGKLSAERTAVRERATLVQGDLTDFEIQGRFGLAVIAYNTLMHLNPLALAFCLGNARKHLRPGGALFVDVDNPIDVHDPAQDGLLLLERAVHDPESDQMVVLTISSVGDGEQQTRETVWIVDASPATGGAAVRSVAQATLHYYFAHQLNQILATAGFEVIAQYGDYDRRPYDDESTRLLLLAAASQ